MAMEEYRRMPEAAEPLARPTPGWSATALPFGQQPE